MLTKRIIPCLDVDKGKVVKGKSFINLVDAGDPVELAKKYYDSGADEIVFLGAWCRSYSNKDFMQSSQSKTIKYHWSNRTKLRNDYSYLEILFERCLSELAASLNTYHNTNYSLRYWRIILGPWLLSYVSVLWDRWESLRVAFETEDIATMTVSSPS